MLMTEMKMKIKMKMKMIKVGDDEGYLVMKVIQSWKLSSEESDESYKSRKKWWRVTFCIYVAFYGTPKIANRVILAIYWVQKMALWVPEAA